MHKVLLFSSFLSLSLSLSLSASQNPWPQRGLSAFTLSKDDKKNRISATMKEPHLVKSLIYIVLSLSLSPLLFFGSMLVKLWLPSLYLYKKKIFCMSVESLCVHLLEHLDEVVHNFSILVSKNLR